MYRSRSRSPVKSKTSVNNGFGNKNSVNLFNNMNMNAMMMNGMMPQGSMMMQGGMYPSLMMPSAMIAGNNMISQQNMEMANQQSSLELLSQPTIDMTMAQPIGVQPIAGQQIPTQPMAAQPMAAQDMSLMLPAMMDSTMMTMGNYSMGMDVPVPERKELVLNKIKLVPPPPGSMPPSRRPRPPGCRTIFIGGLPEYIRESTVREIFDRFGRIDSIRLSKKNFCHIRYNLESSVDAALAISGYKIVRTDKDDDDSNPAWLHVDYANSRDDQKEDEGRQQMMLAMQQMNSVLPVPAQTSAAVTPRRPRRSPSPPRAQPFTQTALIQLAEKNKIVQHFSSTLPTLVTWLERGECNKKNSSTFYSMIQVCNSHIRRLYNEKDTHEEELQSCKERTKSNILNIIDTLEQVGRVLAAASHQRVWDHFTKAQRKNIETWQRMAQDFAHLKEEYKEKYEADDEPSWTNINSNALSSSDQNPETAMLKKENENLKVQLEAYKNEIAVVKLEAGRDFEKFKAQFIARQALDNAMGLNNQKPPLPSVNVNQAPPPPPPQDSAASTVTPGSTEAKLIALLATFLQVHPRGASADSVAAYVSELVPAAEASRDAVLHTLQRHPALFHAVTDGTSQPRWVFTPCNQA